MTPVTRLIMTIHQLTGADPAENGPEWRSGQAPRRAFPPQGPSATTHRTSVPLFRLSKIKTFLESEPSEGMVDLVKALYLVPASYFFISPDDYRDNTIISRESRMSIETEIANVANERFPSSRE